MVKFVPCTVWIISYFTLKMYASFDRNLNFLSLTNQCLNIKVKFKVYVTFDLHVIDIIKYLTDLTFKPRRSNYVKDEISHLKIHQVFTKKEYRFCSRRPKTINSNTRYNDISYFSNQLQSYIFRKHFSKIKYVYRSIFCNEIQKIKQI